MKKIPRKRLTPEQHRILREKGTELAFTGKYWNHKGKGMYRCVGCGAELFDSKTKFDSGTGWPSFYEGKKGAVKSKEDRSYGMRRIEVICTKCGGHLGHVFDDAPTEKGGKRFCINSACLDFKERK